MSVLEEYRRICERKICGHYFNVQVREGKLFTNLRITAHGVDIAI